MTEFENHFTSPNENNKSNDQQRTLKALEED